MYLILSSLIFNNNFFYRNHLYHHNTQFIFWSLYLIQFLHTTLYLLWHLPIQTDNFIHIIKSFYHLFLSNSDFLDHFCLPYHFYFQGQFFNSFENQMFLTIDFRQNSNMEHTELLFYLIDQFTIHLIFMLKLYLSLPPYSFYLLLSDRLTIKLAFLMPLLFLFLSRWPRSHHFLPIFHYLLTLKEVAALQSFSRGERELGFGIYTWWF